MSTWRNRAEPIIRRVIEEHRDAPIAQIRQALTKAFPWGERGNHPYKIWLSECRRQLAELELKRNPRGDLEGLPLFDGIQGEAYQEESAAGASLTHCGKGHR